MTTRDDNEVHLIRSSIVVVVVVGRGGKLMNRSAVARRVFVPLAHYIIYIYET